MLSTSQETLRGRISSGKDQEGQVSSVPTSPLRSISVRQIVRHAALPEGCLWPREPARHKEQHVLNVYNLMSVRIHEHQRKHHHNQGNRYIQCLPKCLCIPTPHFLLFVFLASTLSMRLDLLTNFEMHHTYF